MPRRATVLLLIEWSQVRVLLGEPDFHQRLLCVSRLTDSHMGADARAGAGYYTHFALKGGEVMPPNFSLLGPCGSRKGHLHPPRSLGRQNGRLLAERDPPPNYPFAGPTPGLLSTPA